MNLLIKYFWVFTIGCFLGSIFETVWCFIMSRKFQKRKDLIYGYFTSMYGIAGMVIAMLVELFEFKNVGVIFLVSVVVSGIVEYGTSYIQEKSMGVLFWDYSQKRLNLHGRVNLTYLLGFGLVGVVWSKGYPVILGLLETIISSQHLLAFLAILLFLFMIFNFLVSYVVGIRQKNRRKGISAQNRLEIWIDDKYTDEYIAKVFPNLIFVDEKQS